VPDGRSALERLESDEPIDLVLLDIMMPFVSGLDVLAELRKMPHRRDTPVIILTAKGQDADRTTRHGARRDRFLHQALQPQQATLARIDELFV
jgi:CheY-like chemotaxis protein